MTTEGVFSTGLTLKQLEEIITDLEDGFQSIYGEDINLDQNSPDGQLIGILSQQLIDLRELLAQVYNSFDPDAAEGVVLDSRVALNGITRRAGTYTIAPVEVTVDRALTLNGISTGNPFTVADSAGNQFYLIDTQTPVGAGTESYSFRAKDIGAVQVSINDITSQVTVVVGVTSVNNPSGASSIGEDEEADADLKVRRQVSMAISTTNSLDSLRANLLNLDEVSDVYVHENFAGADDEYSVPGHTIWPIVEGGETEDIAQAIYAKRSAGCGMHGTVEEVVVRPNGEEITIKFDRPDYVPLFIQFYLTAKTAGATYDADELKASLAEQLTYNIFETANAAEITTLLQQLAPLHTPSGVEISDDEITWVEILACDTPQNKFTVSATNIEILEP